MNSSCAGPGRPRDPEVDSAILNAVGEMLTERGFGGLAMEQVAERAGVSKASVYRRFANRSELLEAACAEFAPALPETPDTGSTNEDLVELLVLMAEAMSEPSAGGPLPAILAAAGSHPEARDALRRFSDNRRKPMTEVIDRGRARGDVDPALDGELVADLLAGAVLFRSLVRGEEISEKRLRRYVEMLDLEPDSHSS